jgi:hypothetical protein
MASRYRRLLAVLALLLPQPAAADPPRCATPETNPYMTRDIASRDLAWHRAQAQSEAPIALPSHVVATAELELDFRPEPLRITEPGQLASLIEEEKHGGYRTISCAEIAEIRGAILCLFHDIATGNLAFYRAATWIEGSRSAALGHVAAGHFVPDYAAYADTLKPPGAYVDGVDLEGHDLAAYRDAAIAACARDKSVCLNTAEQAVFDHFLLPLAKQRGDYVILGTSYGRTAIISHEILHGQYFLFPKYRAVVDCYFETVLSDTARQEVRTDLEESYDVKNAFLVRNEFQAYLLQSGATSHLPHLRATQREALLGLLHDAGDFPVMLSLP